MTMAVPLGGNQFQDKTHLGTPKPEASKNGNVTDVSKVWTAPDGSFTKCILKPGWGFTAPNDGAICRVKLMVPASATNINLDLGYPRGEEVEITLGNGCGKWSSTVDACLETMHQEEECELNIFDVRGENWQRQGDSQSQISSVSCSSDEAIISTVHIILHSFIRTKDIYEMTVADILVRATQLKELGTQCFKDSKQEQAERFYIHALHYLISVCHPNDVKNLDELKKEEYIMLKRICSLNLAACKLKCKRYRDVIIHCCYAVEDDPTNTKALYRRCQAYLALDEFESARADIQVVLDSDPNNKLFLNQHRLLVRREKQVYSKLSAGMSKMFGGS